MNPKNNLQVFETVDALSEAAAKFISDLANKAVAAKGKFSIALSGGHTPEQLYALLAKSPFRENIPWKNCYFFWGDERCVPLDDERNNSRMAKTILLDKIDIPATNIFPTPVNLPPAEAAKAYERSIKNFFGNEPMRFDLILLGLGENGHTASLFPGTPIVHEQSPGIREVYVEEQKMFRITMTAPLINNAHNILFLVAGEGKAAILKTIFTAPFQPDKYPAQLINPVDGQLYWLVDKDAAALLS